MAVITINGKRVKPFKFMEFDDDDSGTGDEVEGLVCSEA